MLVSALSLMGIALDRHRALKVRSVARNNTCRAVIIIAGIDILSLAMAIPYSVNIKVMSSDERDGFKKNDGIFDSGLSCAKLSSNWNWHFVLLH